MCISHSPFNAGNASLFVCLHDWAIACTSCATKQTFAQCRIFLVGTLVARVAVTQIDQYAGEIHTINVSSEVRRCAVPQDYLCSEISFSGACNIPNLISYIPVVSKFFSYFPPYKPKHCRFLPNRNHRKDIYEQYTLPAVKEQ